MTNLAAKGDPTALFDAAREQATDPDALTRDMCAGRDMDADLRFREIRAALVRNNEALCGGFWGRRALASPASIELGMIPGVIVNLALTVLLFVALGWVWLRVAGLGRSRPNKKVLRGDQVAPKHAGGR
ncbi:hypothetical protein [Brevundimonas sp.]|uniref:hypothetical protein n=1 Tax=Brevundimonas sp. TaxID=1871086 RepID=UPI003D0FF751